MWLGRTSVASWGEVVPLGQEYTCQGAIYIIRGGCGGRVGDLCMWHTHEDMSRFKQRHKSVCIWTRQTTGTQTETVRGNRDTQTPIWKYVIRLHMCLRVQMGHSVPADWKRRNTGRPSQSTYIVGRDEKQIEAVHTIERKPKIGRWTTKRGSLQAVVLDVNLQGAVKKCDVSWDEITLKAKAEGFVWSQVTQLHVCLAGIYPSWKTVKLLLSPILESELR